MNGTNKKHMVSYTVDMSEKSPVSLTLHTCDIPDPQYSFVSRMSRASHRYMQITITCLVA